MVYFIVALIIVILVVLDQVIRAKIRKKNMIKNGTYVKEWPDGFKEKIAYFFKKIKGLTWIKVKKFFIGRKFTDGFIFKVVIYTLLVSIGYVYVYPVLYMLSTSFKSPEDLINPTVLWIPTTFYFDNYVKAYNVLKYFPTLFKSMLITLLPALIQTAICSLIGYGFAKFEFKGKKFWFVLIVLTF